MHSCFIGYFRFFNCQKIPASPAGAMTDPVPVAAPVNINPPANWTLKLYRYPVRCHRRGKFWPLAKIRTRFQAQPFNIISARPACYLAVIFGCFGRLPGVLAVRTAAVLQVNSRVFIHDHRPHFLFRSDFGWCNYYFKFVVIPATTCHYNNLSLVVDDNDFLCPPKGGGNKPTSRYYFDYDLLND